MVGNRQLVSDKPSAAQYAYESLKEWILSGFLVPGEKIDQDEAARKLNLSRMPIRSALDRLSSEGLVNKIPHRGATVSPLSDVTLNHIYDVRAQLEAMAIMSLTSNVTSEILDKLYNTLFYQQNVADTSIMSILEMNRKFHQLLVQLSGNEVLLRLFDNIWEQCERYRRIYFQIPHSNDRIQAEHRRIVDLVASGDAQGAADFIVKHTRSSQQVLLELMGKPLPPLQQRLIFLAPNAQPPSGQTADT